MAINLQPVPRYCVDCANFKPSPTSNYDTHGRCVAPKAPPTHPLADGEQYVSERLPDESRAFASSLRKDPEKCGPQGEWFEAKPAGCR